LRAQQLALRRVLRVSQALDCKELLMLRRK
jgi:hypothetical protein